MDNIRHYIKSFLTFTRWEQRGIALLVVIILALMVFNLTYEPKIKVVEKKDISAQIKAYEEKVEASKRILAERRSQKYSTKKRYESSNSYYAKSGAQKTEKSERFLFDPNKISKDSLVRLGFSAKQADVIVNYRSKGGAFRTPDDFGKMYVVDARLFEKLRPYISISEQKSPAIAKRQSTKPVDLNSADTTELIALRGVGSTLAKKIVVYREKLGGYARYDQLLEIYGFDEERLPEFVKQLSPLSAHKRIKINSVSVDELKKHPYLTAYEARSIVYYRMKQGPIERPEQLISAKLVDKKRFEKLKDYIDYTK